MTTHGLHGSSFLGLPYRILHKGTTMEPLGIGFEDLQLGFRVQVLGSARVWVECRVLWFWGVLRASPEIPP